MASSDFDRRHKATGNLIKLHVGCVGCLTWVFVAVVLWALFFGVTVDGKHYGLSCSRKDGVRLDR